MKVNDEVAAATKGLGSVIDRRTVVRSESLIRTLIGSTHTATARLDEVLKPAGLSLDQWLVIDALAKDGGLTMADLADQAMVTGPTLTRVVDRLVSNAQVYREVDANDRRRIRVYLSRRGRSAHQRIAAKVENVERELLDSIGGVLTLRSLNQISD